MRFALTEQQRELAEAVANALARECTTGDLRDIAASLRPGDPAFGRSATRWLALSEMGVPGLLVPDAYGGIGLDEVAMTGVLELAGRFGLPEPLGVTAAVAAPLLTEVARNAAPDTSAHILATTILAKLATGEAIATVGGADAGTDGPVGTTAPAPDVTQGTIRTPRVEGAGRADVFMLCWDLPGGGWQIHGVNADAVDVIRTPSIDATRDVGSVEWTPWPHTLLASGDAAGALVAEMTDRAAVAVAAELLGLTERMIEVTAEYAKARHQFGKPIGSFQAVKHHLANTRIRLEMARPAVYRAAYALAHSESTRAVAVSVAKSLASDAADLTGRIALQVHGAIGYTWECDLHLFMKQAWVRSAAWGNATLHRARVLAAALERIGVPT